MKSIIDSRDLNTRLHNLYRNRELIEFAHSKEMFNQQALAIWTEWLKYQMKTPATPGSIQAELDVLDTPEFNKGCWELDNGYEEEFA